MSWLTVFVPTLLLMHNTVDFSTSNACASYVNCLNYVVTNYVEMLENNNPGLRLVNKGGHLGDKIYSLELQFESLAKYPLEEARLMMLQLVDSFVEAINSYPRVRAHLADCSFTSANLIIRVNFVSDCFYPYSETKYIKYMTFMDDKIVYEFENPYNPGQLVILRDESLARARVMSTLPE